MFLGRERNSFSGHAIGTAQIAALGDGDTEVVVLSVEGIGQEGR